MSSNDGPWLIGSVLSIAWDSVKASWSVFKFFASMWHVVAKFFWRQAHFGVGVGLSVTLGVLLSLALNTSVFVTVLVVSLTTWHLFLPTEDLVWMSRRGYVSPAYVRVGMSVLASFVGIDDEVETAEREAEAALAAKVKRYEDANSAKKHDKPKTPSGWTDSAMPDEVQVTEKDEAAGDDDDEDEDKIHLDSDSSDDDDDAVTKKKRLKRRLRKLQGMRTKGVIKKPLRAILRQIMRHQGLLPGVDESEDDMRRRMNQDENDASISGNTLGGRKSSRDNLVQKNIPKRALPDPKTWPHRPVFVRFSPRDNGTQKALAGWATQWGPDTSNVGEKNPPKIEEQNCPVNTETAMHFESELFIGTIVCRFKGIICPNNTYATKTTDAFFKKKRCTFQVLVQGKFKEEVSTEKILTGGEFHKPFTERPPNYLVSAGCKFFAALTPGLELDLLCPEPYYTATLGGTVTVLSVDDEEDAPDPLSDVVESNAKLGGAFRETSRNIFGGVADDDDPITQNGSSTPTTPTSPKQNGSAGLSVSKRCRILGDPATAKNYTYNTTDVYTFDYFQSVLLFDVYCLDIGIVKLKLYRHVDGQPLGIMAKHVDGRYLYNFEIFHECLLPKTEQGRC